MISFFKRLGELLSPRACVACGCRLAPGEDVVCVSCNLKLPRTLHTDDMFGNELARMFWGKFPVEQCAAMMYYSPSAEPVRMIYRLKYGDEPELGVLLGMLMAKEWQDRGFFDGIDFIVPVPLADERLRDRGYNQSVQIAVGMEEVVHIPVREHVLRRRHFCGSQTRRTVWERLQNVEDAFELMDDTNLCGSHVLLVDDVVTTGATMTACAKEIARLRDVRISVAAFAFAGKT